MSIADNLSLIREQIAKAATRAGRNSAEVELMAVSKTFPAERIEEAYEAGQRVFGENRVQEFAEKAPTLGAREGTTYHLIGHLQSNKAARAVELFNCIDSIDSARLLRKLNDAAARLEKQLPVLIEINVGGEEQKSGVPPVSLELEEILLAAPQLQHVRICGLMTIPPWSENPEHARPYFRMLRHIREDLAKRNLPGVGLDVLSMGMSNDFQVAIEEGSTQVRIGTAIFGRRTKL
ncbi:MAG TPA: YggS family pyridoxal phosphate-dependent enzyme [Terriglobales bacterium]|nr:YggS family pyridoxal phosphate-dependent enzyme [Terriglobales bacterium]